MTKPISAEGLLRLEARQLNEFAEFLEVEARRIKFAREKGHGGTRNRMDLVTWADALQWAARKARERAIKDFS